MGLINAIGNLIGTNNNGGFSPTDNYVDVYESTTGQIVDQTYVYESTTGLKIERVKTYNT